MSDRFDHTLERTLETKPANGADDSVTTVRRIELITGDGRRRRWSDDEKASIVVESLRPGANASEVARRNGLSPQQLFGWRREARASLIAGQGGASDAPPPERSSPAETRRDRRKSRAPGGERSPAERAPAFASVVVATSAAAPTAAPPPASLPASPASGRIEIALGDAVVRVIGQVEPATLAAVLRVVRRAT